MAHFHITTLINAPVDKVDAVVGDVHKWPAFMNGVGEPTKITGTGSVGTVVEHPMTIMWGVRRPAVTKVVEERHDPDGGTFWKWEQKGTVQAWWSCHHQPRDGQTLAVTELEYTMPWGVLGKACDALFVSGGQKRAMDMSLQKVKGLAEGA